MVLSGHAIDHMVLYAGFVDSIKHQVRWMKSTRFSRPKGHFGTGLTFGVPFGLLALGGGAVAGHAGAGVGSAGGECAGANAAGVGGGEVCGAEDDGRGRR